MGIFQKTVASISRSYISFRLLINSLCILYFVYYLFL